MTTSSDVQLLRELATQYMALFQDDEQRRRRDLWRAHNSLTHTLPPIYVRAIPWEEVPEAQQELCQHALYRNCEQWLRKMLVHASMGDDYTFEPWFTLPASCVTPADGLWGLPTTYLHSDEPRGSWKVDPPIKTLADVEKMVTPRHLIDEEATTNNWERLQEAIGDILPVVVDRAPLYRMWEGDIITRLAYMRGLEQLMWDMSDNPEWLHELLAFMRDGILATHDAAEAAGDWRLCDHQNQAMPYAEELPDPSADTAPVARKQLWYFMAAQELTLVSPAMHEEFLLRYQLPIMEKFGLTAYGCCEDLSNKIDMLRQIPNLRRIAVAPSANVRRCAEQIGEDYVISYRPNPATMVSCAFDPDYIRAKLHEDLAACQGCHIDITLKDVETVQGDIERLRIWARIAREVAEEFE